MLGSDPLSVVLVKVDLAVIAELSGKAAETPSVWCICVITSRLIWLFVVSQYGFASQGEPVLSSDRRMLAIVVILGLSLLSLQYAILGVSAQASNVSGKVYGFDMYGNLVTLSWAKVTARGEGVESSAYTRSGAYALWLPSGTYNVTVSHQGYFPKSMMLAVSPGSSTSVDFVLDPTGIPIPEFSDGIVWLGGLAILVCLIVTRRRKSHGGRCVR